jgi:predicted Fe-S protein YdhL (DUF1289 family)
VRDEEAYEWRLREEVVAWQQLVDHERTAHLHAIACVHSRRIRACQSIA